MSNRQRNVWFNLLTYCQGKMSSWGIAYQQHEFVFYLNFYIIACLVFSAQTYLTVIISSQSICWN